MEESASDKQGVEVGDLILEVNGRRVTTANDMLARLAASAAVQETQLLSFEARFRCDRGGDSTGHGAVGKGLLLRLLLELFDEFDELVGEVFFGCFGEGCEAVGVDENDFVFS